MYSPITLQHSFHVFENPKRLSDLLEASLGGPRPYVVPPLKAIATVPCSAQLSGALATQNLKIIFTQTGSSIRYTDWICSDAIAIYGECTCTIGRLGGHYGP